MEARCTRCKGKLKAVLSKTVERSILGFSNFGPGFLMNSEKEKTIAEVIIKIKCVTCGNVWNSIEDLKKEVKYENQHFPENEIGSIPEDDNPLFI